jgi:glycosyltransferase involved in cell wall biosynthesis
MSHAKRILYSTPVLAYPPQSGPALRVASSIKALAQVGEIYLHCRTAMSASTLAYYSRYCARVWQSPSGRQPWHVMKRIANRVGHSMLRRDLVALDGPRDHRDALRLCQEIVPDVVWLGHGQISYELLRYLKNTNAKLKIVLDTDSIWSRYVLRELPFVAKEGRRRAIVRAAEAKQEEERWGTALADVTTSVSDVDARYYKELNGAEGRVSLFSNVIDVDDYKAVPPAPACFRRPALCLAGTFWPGSPMEDASRWLIDHVLPLVKRSVPQVHLYVIGRGSDRVLADVRDQAVTVTGRVNSVLPFLFHCDASLVPLRFESGTRFKILEAGACRKPVVSTTLGAEGLPVEHGESIMLADSVEGFAEAIIRVLLDRDLAERLGGNLGRVVERQFSIDALARQASAVLEYLGSLA